MKERGNPARARVMAAALAVAIVASGMLIATPARAALSFVKSIGGASSKANSTTMTIATTGAVAAGNSVILAVALDNAAGAVSASDPGGSYTVDADRPHGTADAVRTVILSRHNVAAMPSGTIITVTTPTSIARAAVALDVSGIEAVSPRDGAAGNDSTGTIIDSTSTATTQADEFLIGAVGVEAKPDETFTEGMNWTTATDLHEGTTGGPTTGNVTINAEHGVATAVGNYSATGLLSNSRDWSAVIATYKKDVTAPAVSLSAPADGSNTNDTTPTVSGTAGNNNSDSTTVTVRVFSGASEVRTLTPTRAGTAWTVDITPALPQGTYTWSAEQSDSNNLGTSGTRTIVVDTQALAPAIGPGPADPSADETPEWTFSGEAAATFTCSLSNTTGVVDPASPCVSPYSFDLGAEADDEYTFSVTQTDLAGNASPAATSTFTLDSTAQAPSIDARPANQSSDETPQWQFSGEAGATFECELNGPGGVVDPAAPCTSPYDFDLSGENDGDYTFSVSQTDALGNPSAAATDTYDLDRQVDAPSIDVAPNDPSNLDDPQWEFSGEAGATFECQLSDSFGTVDPPAPCTSPYTFNLLGADDDDYTFSVTQTDAAGNTSGAATHTHTIDREVGLPTIDAAPSDPSNDDGPQWGFSGEAGATFECELSDTSGIVDPAAPCTSPYTFDLAGADDDYTFSVTQTDPAGNTSAAASDTFTLDTLPAGAPTFDSQPGDATADPVAQWDFSGEPGATFDCALSGPDGFSDADPACAGTYSFDLTAELDGDYTFSVTQTDMAGNTSAAATDTFTLDRQATAPTFDADPGDATNDPMVQWDFSGEPGATFDCALSGPNGFSDVDPTCAGSYSIDLTAELDGTYTFTVSQTDALGNVSPDATHVVELDRVAPSAPAVGATPPPKSSDNTPTWSWSGEPGANYTCEVKKGTTVISSGPCTSPYTITLPGSGSYVLIVTQVDDAGNASAGPMTSTYTFDGQAPVVSSLKASRNPFNLRKRKTVITFRSNEAGKGSVVIKKGSKTIRKLGTKSLAANVSGKFVWNGKDSKHRKVRPSKYVVVVTMTDAVGNKTIRKLTIRVKR